MDYEHNFKSLEKKKKELQNLFKEIDILDEKHLEYIDKIEDFICFYTKSLRS